tara:strand:+ start:1122 stop:1769 length:648 start_codon:yes stop_codon:yes gene_type:complete
MSQPIIKSQYQYLRLWFEFYKLALKDKSLKNNLDKSKHYYKPWGNVKTVMFDEWFKTHGDLFAITKVKEITGKLKQYESTINVSIPLNQSVTELLKSLKILITKKQKENPPIQYQFTEGVIRGKTLYEILLIYTIYINNDKPPINNDFVKKILEFFNDRKRSNWKPFIIGTYNVDQIYMKYSDTQIRSLRRYIKKGEQVTRSVSLGKFPGNSSLK